MTQSVFSNEMVAHVWAQGDAGRTGRSNNGQFYFQGRELYSYGSHFMAGYIAAPGVVFLNSDSYSITTSRHMSHASYATSHYSQRFHVAKLQDYRDALSAIVRHRAGRLDRESLQRWRKRMDSVVAPLVGPSPDAARWMLQEIGLKAERLDVIARRLEREAARKLAADTREAVATWRKDGRTYSEMSSSEFAGTINAIRFQENTYRAESDLEHLAQKLHRAHKQANADKFNRRKVTLWARLQRVREARKALQESGLATYVNTTPLALTVRAIAGLRQLLAHTSRGDIPGPRAFDQGARNVATLLTRAKVSPATRERLEALEARLRGASDALTRELEREAFAALEAERAEWLSGARSYTRARLSDERGGALVRAVGAELDGCRVIAGDLETSHGARVPLRHAAAVFAFVRRIRESAISQGILGESTVWRAGQGGRTIRVGHFSVDEIRASGDFVAGCHRINWSETERLARELGLWTCDLEALEALDEPTAA